MPGCHRGVEERVRLREAKVVRGVEIVHDQCAVDAACVQAQIEIAERRWMGICRDGAQQANQQQRGSTHSCLYDARSALDLMALSQVIRRIALPGKMTRQYGVNRRRASESVAKIRVSVSSLVVPPAPGSIRKFIVAFAKAGSTSCL